MVVATSQRLACDALALTMRMVAALCLTGGFRLLMKWTVDIGSPYHTACTGHRKDAPRVAQHSQCVCDRGLFPRIVRRVLKPEE